MALGLWNFRQNISFPHFFFKRFQILSWILVCGSNVMSYRSRSSFVPLCRFLLKFRPLDYEIFAEITVFRTFFQNPFRYWAEFWYVSLTWWVTDQVRVSFRSIYFYRSYGPWTLYFRQNNSFPHFFSKRIQILSWYLVCNFIECSHIALTEFRSVGHLLPVCRAGPSVMAAITFI